MVGLASGTSVLEVPPKLSCNSPEQKQRLADPPWMRRTSLIPSTHVVFAALSGAERNWLPWWL